LNKNLIDNELLIVETFFLKQGWLRAGL